MLFRNKYARPFVYQFIRIGWLNGRNKWIWRKAWLN